MRQKSTRLCARALIKRAENDQKREIEFDHHNSDEDGDDHNGFNDAARDSEMDVGCRAIARKTCRSRTKPVSHCTRNMY